LNEEKALRNLESSFLEFCKANSGWTILFFDDGSTDDTWNLLSKLVSKSSNIYGLRSNVSIGKIAAQGNAIRFAFQNTSRDHDFQIAIMDSDGQHPLRFLEKMIKESGESKKSIFGNRIKFRRKLGSRVGRHILKIVLRGLGVQANLNISEFGVLTNKHSIKIASDSKLGFLPFSLLVEKYCDELTFIDFEVAPRIGGTSKRGNSRHDSSQLFRKGLLYLYSDPWKIIWKLATRSLLIFCAGIFYGVFVGIQSVMNDNRNGISSVVLIVSILSLSLFLILLSIVGILMIAKEENSFETSKSK
jgi:glycosyltransferase involved in cell wall biosynthesis